MHSILSARPHLPSVPPQFIAWLAAAGRAAEVACLAVVARITLLVLAPSILHFYLLLYAPAAYRQHRWGYIGTAAAGLAHGSLSMSCAASTLCSESRSCSECQFAQNAKCQ